MISNSWGTHNPDEFLAFFDVVFISSEVGLRKPQPQIYELALERLGFTAAEVVLVDDGAANIEAVERVGITGILYPRPEATKEALAGLVPANTTDPLSKEHIS